MDSISASLKVSPQEVLPKVAQMVAQLKELMKENKSYKQNVIKSEASSFVGQAVDGIVAIRYDGASPDELRTLAFAIRDEMKSGAVGVVGLSGDKSKAGICVALSRDVVANGLNAEELASQAVGVLGGGTAKNADFVVGGGQNIGEIDNALKESLMSAKQ